MHLPDEPFQDVENQEEEAARTSLHDVDWDTVQWSRHLPVGVLTDTQVHTNLLSIFFWFVSLVSTELSGSADLTQLRQRLVSMDRRKLVRARPTLLIGLRCATSTGPLFTIPALYNPRHIPHLVPRKHDNEGMGIYSSENPSRTCTFNDRPGGTATNDDNGQGTDVARNLLFSQWIEESGLAAGGHGSENEPNTLVNKIKTFAGLIPNSGPKYRMRASGCGWLYVSTH